MAPKAKGKAKAKGRAGGSQSPTPAGKAKARAKAKAGAVESPPPPPTEEEIAAARLRAFAHSFLARRMLGELLDDHQRHEAELQEAVRAAEVAALKIERKKAEQAREKEAAKRAKAKQLAEDTRKLLAAAFDGDVTELGRLLDAGLPVNVHDANGTTALSEASSGGAADAARLLIERRSDPNSRGEFQRTPLWRAAYAGHEHMVAQLLEAGCDPRLYDEQGQAPVDVTSKDNIQEILRSWDVSKTDDLVDEYETWFEEARILEDFRQKEAMRSVSAEFEQAMAGHEAAQAILAKAKCQMRSREKEHGVGLAAGSEQARLACSSAAAELARAQDAAIAAQRRLDEANVSRLAAAEACGANDTSTPPGREVNVADLNNVILRDIGERLASASKWPLLIDPTDCARKLLVYAGCAVLNFWSPEDMLPGRLRLALLSMIRAGGVLAVDLACFGAGVDLELLAQPFHEVRPWLFAELLERQEGKAKLFATLPKQTWPRFHELVEKEEKKAYGVEHFDEKRTAKFKFVVLTSAEFPHKVSAGRLPLGRLRVQRRDSSAPSICCG